MEKDEIVDTVEILRSVLNTPRPVVLTDTDTLIESTPTTEEFVRKFDNMVKSDIGFVKSFRATTGSNQH